MSEQGTPATMTQRQPRKRRTRSPEGRLRDLLRAVLCALVFVSAFPSVAGADSRIKDLVDFEGVRDNQLVGYGLKKN